MTLPVTTCNVLNVSQRDQPEGDTMNATTAACPLTDAELIEYAAEMFDDHLDYLDLAAAEEDRAARGRLKDIALSALAVVRQAEAELARRGVVVG
ncbi:DNA binding protein [Gordonia phage Trine]|uniref:DNA binding protein n=1 Tax=Gordonia phage Trine TaxID=2201431 RepID=A0A2Z4Q922_9CAUD|nr:DNA binding protein [Gordonia phage Trine]AWY06551.1 DNA binding protein [Gordonia phage Trine]